MYFSCLSVSFHVFSCLSSRCLFVCEVQSFVLILVVKKVSIPILVYFFFQLILDDSSDFYYKLNKTNFVNMYPVFSRLFVSFRVFSCLFASFRAFSHFSMTAYGRHDLVVHQDVMNHARQILLRSVRNLPTFSRDILED